MLTQTACDEPSNEHEDGSSGGPEDKLLDRQRRHSPPERHFTCHLLFLRLDTSPDSQSWRPPWKSTKTTVYERLDLKGAIHWVVNLIFITTETHDNAHALTTSIQQLILPIFTISNLRLKLNTGGRNSSDGSAWARCPQCRGFDPPLGTFSGRGDFSLGVNMGSNSIPPKAPSDESINRGLVCAHIHFIARTQKILTFMS